MLRSAKVQGMLGSVGTHRPLRLAMPAGLLYEQGLWRGAANGASEKLSFVEFMFVLCVWCFFDCFTTTSLLRRSCFQAPTMKLRKVDPAIMNRGCC